ncbi:MAG: hypothetical protein CBC12_02660 [Candidatus Puniceispirillum sp. TMED52]|nr:hypothetical protein [SAR116 cluster bacterium]OUU53484.1 MAG: hypothetical protein CBC12_02660 [Candidatus Puniceispirillum sp. TMED52]HCP19203.1 hypothetical protein [Alphaproteobacteria bacterium]|tara:strand:+ start:1512 stop:1874 length:363 start_codon:yes stop_codon:yes gene_type:complete
MISQKDKKKAEEMVGQAEQLLERADTEPNQESQLAEQARNLLNEAIAFDPSNSDAWSNRGAAKTKLGDHEDASSDCDEAIRLNPRNASAWSTRGSAKFYLGDYQGAITDCDELYYIKSHQ